MITVIIFLIVGIVIGLYNASNEWYQHWIDYVVFSILGAIVGTSIGICVSIILPMDLSEKSTTMNLESLQDGSNVSGKFFLGCGQIEGKMKYVFYYEKDGFYHMDQIDYSLVKIRFSYGHPKITTIQLVPTDSDINRFALDMDCFDKKYIIDVPKGTIMNNYNLDAK